MVIENNDFIEIEFVAKTREGEIFDTTKKDVGKIMGIKEEIKPLIVPVGKNFLLKGLEKDLVGKEIGKEYKVEIKAEEAFGKRNPNLVQMISIKVFNEKGINPKKGMSFSFDNQIGKIISISGGRVLIDFNNPLAGKEVIYEYKVLRKVEDKKEQFDALQNLLFNKKFDSSFLEKDTIEVKVDEKFYTLFEIMKKKIEEMINCKLLIKKN